MTAKDYIQSDFLKTYQRALTQKSERVVSALYLVSSLMSDQEPLKWEIRKKALETLSHARNGAGESIVRCAEDSIDLVSLANRSTLISTMNAELLDSGLRSLIQSISQGGMLSDEFLKVSQQEVSVPRVEAPANPIKDKNLIGQNSERSVSYKRQSSVPKKTYPRKDKRRDKVVDALGKKRESSIKDIVRQVRGCSEKTIQRELNSLIAEGIVSKKGERRWSVYSLA